jgi:hypothetical protein
VTLTSTLPHLGVDVDLNKVAAVDFDGKPLRVDIVDGSRTVHLPPNGRATFEARLRPAVKAGNVFALPPATREEIDVSLKLDGTAQATPTRLIKDLGVDPVVKIDAPDQFTVGRTVGRTWPQFIFELLLLMVLLGILGWIWRSFLQTPPLVGELVLTNAPRDAPPAVRLKGKRMKVAAKDFGAGGPTVVVLSTKRGRRRRMFATMTSPEGSSFERMGRSEREWMPIESGSEIVPEGRYRIDGLGGAKFRWRKGAAE